MRLKVIHHACLPWKLPIWQTATAWLVLDRLHTGRVGMAVFYTLISLVWIIVETMVFEQQCERVHGFGNIEGEK